ncbi:Rv3654c family TadE-like protein [Nocardioides caldifontis]|uniref:Rv3654c family TadE-like protein n=1 Tax=Nocardioides caldifontis TaxID=2588938 RepID=UPI0011DF4E65|nr:Rv3654c family TadE-like protein [Nocardioides caldifontis]
MTRRQRDQAGLAVPVVVAGIALLATLALVVALLGRLVADQRRAAAAADLAALAAAAATQFGEEPCPAAARAAEQNGSRLTACVVDGDRVRVRAVRESASVLGRTLEVLGEAHAGPVR